MHKLDSNQRLFLSPLTILFSLILCYVEFYLSCLNERQVGSVSIKPCKVVCGCKSRSQVPCHNVGHSVGVADAKALFCPTFNEFFFSF